MAAARTVMRRLSCRDVFRRDCMRVLSELVDFHDGRTRRLAPTHS
jgi:hypothetical protein